MSYYMPDSGVSVFLEMLFDEGEKVKWEQDPDIIDVEPLESSTERSSDACCTYDGDAGGKPERAEDILRVGDGERLRVGRHVS